MKTHRTILLRGFARLILGVVGFASASVAAAEEAPFDFGSQRYVAGVLEQDVDHATHLTGWRLSDGVYFGRRSGDTDDFGFVVHDGDTQWSLTEAGIGWRRAISLLSSSRLAH